MTKIKGAEIIMECLRKEGVEVIFGYPGGANLPLYDTLVQYPQIIIGMLVIGLLGTGSTALVRRSAQPFLRWQVKGR